MRIAVFDDRLVYFYDYCVFLLKMRQKKISILLNSDSNRFTLNILGEVWSDFDLK